MRVGVVSEARASRMARLLTADNAISALETVVIEPLSEKYTPKLGVMMKANDDNAGTKSYLKAIKRCADKYKSNLDLIEVADASSAYQKLALVKEDPTYDGLIIISDFRGADGRTVQNYIPAPLDIDCASAFSIGTMICDSSLLFYRSAPCTATAVYKMLEYNEVPIEGKRVGVVGRSLRVGRAVAQLLQRANGTVTLYHSKSDLSNLRDMDIVVAAIGKPKHLTANLFREGQIVVDVGINTDENGKLCGDVDFENVKEVLGEDGAITPSPCGIGPLTNAILFSKLYVNAMHLKGGKTSMEIKQC